MRILIVEDEPMLRNGLVDLLKGAGCYRVLFWVIGIFAIAQVALGGELILEQVFTETAQSKGKVYAVGRDMLVKQGGRIIPFLEGKADGENRRERDLARMVILRIKRSDECALWARALSWSQNTVTVNEDGTVRIALHPSELEYAPLRKRKLPVGQVVTSKMMQNEANRRKRILSSLKDVTLERDVIPFLVDCLREHDGNSSVSESYVMARRAWSVLCHLGSVEEIPVVLEYAAMWPGNSPEFQAFFERLGSVAVPALQERLSQSTNGTEIEALARALAAQRVPGALPMIFSNLSRTVHRPRPFAGSPHYHVLRAALVAYGQSAEDFLEEIRRQGQPTQRAIAGGILFEIKEREQVAAFYRLVCRHAQEGGTPIAMYYFTPMEFDPTAWGRAWCWDGGEITIQMPVPVLLERAAVFARGVDMARVAPLPPDDVTVGVMEEALRRRGWCDSECPSILLALAKHDGQQAMAACRTIVAQNRTQCFVPVIEVVLQVGNADGLPVLEEIVREAGRTSGSVGSFGPLAKAVIPLLRGQPDRLSGLLESEDATIRETAARVLARKGDVRALPVLLERALLVQGDAHAAWRDLMIGLDGAALPGLAARREAASDWREKLLCEAVKLRIERPELAATFQKEAALPPPNYAMHTGPGFADFQVAGRRLVTAVGRDALPLLEASVVFRDQPGGMATIVCALGELKMSRSILVLIAGSSYDPWIGGVVAKVLVGFGDEGIEAARKIPAPDPSKEGYNLRSTRHRSATLALDMAGEDTMENIIAGLNQPVSDRTPTYLRLAKKYHDPRLLDALIGLVIRSDGYHQREVFGLLAGYDDRRVERVALEILLLGKSDQSRGAAFEMLASMQGKAMIELLTKELKEAVDMPIRLGAINALGQFVSPSYGQQSFIDQVPLAKRREVLALLITQMASEDPSVQTAAVQAIVGPGGRLNKVNGQGKTIRLVCDWVRHQDRLSYRTIKFLENSRNRAAAPALLSVYRSGNRLDTKIAGALGELHYTAAVDDVIQGYQHRLASATYGAAIPEFDALAKFGGSGLRHVEWVLRESTMLSRRCEAAKVLASHRRASAFDPVLRLLEDQIKQRGPEANSPRRVISRGSSLGPGSPEVILTEALVQLNPTKTYMILSRLVINAPDDGLREYFAGQLNRLEEANPRLKRKTIEVAVEDGRHQP